MQEDFGASPAPQEQQERPVDNKAGCKDPFFALLFYAQLIAVIAVAGTYGKDAFGDTSNYDYAGFVYAAVVCSGFSLILAVSFFVVIIITEIK